MIRGLSCLVVALMFLSGSNAYSQEPNTKKAKVAVKAVSDLSKISNEKVRSAVAAWQAKDLKKWLEHFQDSATLFDDGKPRDFRGFSNEITDEWFTSIDKVEDDGMKVIGQFYTKKWGSFRVYFKFHLSADGKFSRLDIGQAG